MQQVQEVGSPLRIIRNPSGTETSVKAGEKEKAFELSVTVTNHGEKFAIVDIFIDDIDNIYARSGQVRQWCSLPDQQCDLEPGKSCEVVFKFDNIPPETPVGAYNYLLTLDAKQHYPKDTPITYEGLLYVQPPVKEAGKLEAPTFKVQPATNSETPVLLQPGEKLEFQIMVHNRSYRVDRFRLNCPELPREWFKVIYPQGVYSGDEALELNPGDQGQIQLQLTPPANTLARIYSPTIRLYSANKPDLALLDLVYIQVVPVYQLNIEFLTLLGQIKDRAGKFQLRLHNYGNTVREVNLQVISGGEDRLCTYTLTPEKVKLLPGKSQSVSLRVQPKRLWRRPFFGKVFNFAIEVKDLEDLPLQSDRFEGALIWEPRPWWHFWLLIILILGLVGIIAFVIWRFLFNPPQPKIIAFESTSSSYQAGDPIALNWQIANPKKLQTLKLKGISPKGIVTSDPIDYDFSQGIPQQLKNSCYLDRVLLCQNVPTDALKSGDYTFKLSLVPKNAQGIVSTTQSTNTIRIQAKPEIIEVLPKISSLTAKVIEEYKKNKLVSVVLLDWTIDNYSELKELVVIRKLPNGKEDPATCQKDKCGETYAMEKDIDSKIKRLCAKNNDDQLICKNVPQEIEKAGNYIFELIARPKRELTTKKEDSQQTDIISIIKIAEFNINNIPVLIRPKQTFIVNPLRPSTVKISWQVEGGKKIQVELLPSPGKVTPQGEIIYPLSPKDGSETITLQVTSDTGEKISRSAIVETSIKPLVPPPPSFPSSVSPSSSDSDSLAPVELPPKSK